eukprot:GHVN01058887.1.p5 GENE.GHVN01058887.1~~GHVN01058887.1.p5  ORF type:complete len:128 (-),score=1.35 GHVN01058887.1:1917-2300(-)
MGRPSDRLRRVELLCLVRSTQLRCNCIAILSNNTSGLRGHHDGGPRESSPLPHQAFATTEAHRNGEASQRVARVVYSRICTGLPHPLRANIVEGGLRVKPRRLLPGLHRCMAIQEAAGETVPATVRR